MASSLGPIFLFLLATLQLAPGMRVDPERIWARLRIEAGTSANADALQSLASGRSRRQLIGGSPKEETIQVTAPLFSSRLFEYGTRAGDKEITSGLDVAKKLQLSRPLAFFGQSHPALWVLSNGAIGFEQAARQYRANILPSASPMIAPFWNRNDLRNGGRVFYREVATGGRVLERGQSEIRYQYDLEVKVHSAIVVTFEKMQPVGTEPLPDENTNTFQVALFLTSNGTFANFIYSNIGWTQGAEAGFNAGDGNNNFFALPTSGTGNIMYLEDYGNTGIPGEWMFILGEQRIQRCKAGIKGDTCDEACAAGEWGPDCVRCCHCTEEKAGCHEATGECKQGSCAKCWLGIGCQQRDSRCGASQQRQCGQNAVQMTDYNRCGEPQQRCECLAGYQGDDPYTECTDIDECARPNACHQKAQCTNTPGRFFCQCQEGFQGDGVAECVASFLFPFDQSHHLPNDRHGRVEWQLKHPLRIFGRERDSLWLTSNGLILVKGAKNVPTKSGERISLDGMDVQGIAPFFAPIDLAQQQGGQIYVEETTDPRILAKASQLVNEQLGVDQQQQQQQFVASHALLVTYVNVSVGKQAAHQPKATNTFQTLLIGGKDRLKRDSPPMTFVEFLYRDLHWSEDAEAGIMAPDKANSILLPGSGTEGIEQLSQLSNVRSQGIWLYRIDGIAPSACMQADLQPPYCDARSPPLINRSPPPSTPSSSTLAVSSSQTPKKTSPAPPTPSTTFIGTTPQIQQSFGLEDDEELEPVVEQEQSQEMRPSRPELPKVEQNGWIPVEKKQPQPMAGKKPAIVQIQSREFEEMPPDAFDDGTVSRATTRAQEEEKPVDEDIREIVPSLIVPELVKPVSSGVPRQGPPPTSLEGQGQANVKETSVEEATAPRKIPPPPQIRIEQHKPVPITPFTPFTTTQSTSSTTPMDDEETTTSLADEEPMQTIGVDESEEQPTEAIPEQPAIPELVNTEPSPVPSQTVPSAVSTEASSRIFVLFNTTKKPVMSTSTKKMVPKPPMPEPPKQKPENPDGDEPILMDWDQQGNPLLDGTGTAGSKLSIVVPIAIVLVWLVVLVVVAVFLCCRRRQTQERLRTLYGPAYQIRPVYTMRVNKLNGFSGTGTTGEGSYEEHLEKAAQRLSAEMAYNPNPLWAGPGRYSLYGSYWNISPEGSAAGRVNGAAGSKQRPTTTTTTGAAMDISSPRSHESGGAGAGHASASANANGSSLFGNYVQQQLAGGGGHRTGGSAGTTAANGGEQREAAQSEYFSSQLPKRSQPDKPVAIRPGRELKLMKSDCKVYEVGSYVEICLDEFGKPVDEQTVVTPPTPPSTSAYEEDIETYSHVDQSQESIVTVPPEAGMASMQSIESPTDMLSGDDDRSQQSPSVMTPNTSIMTPNTSLVAPTKSLMSKAEEEDIYAVE